MKLYLIYNYKTGTIFRHVTWYKSDEKGNVEAGLDNSSSFVYSSKVFPAPLPITADLLNKIKNKYDRYKVINGVVQEKMGEETTDEKSE